MIDSLALGVYGTLQPNSRSRDFLNLDERPDCYSVFHSLGTVLNFESGPGRGFWGMNDASGPNFSDDGARLLGWFQVSPFGQPDASLPVAPFVSCATSALGRFGSLAATGFEVYLPIRAKHVDEWGMFGAKPWMEMCNPSDRQETSVSIELPDGVDAVQSLGKLEKSLELFEHYQSGVRLLREVQAPPVSLDGSAVPWRWWVSENGSSVHHFRLSLPEWSPTVVGWALSCIAKGLQRSGVNAGVGVRIGLAST